MTEELKPCPFCQKPAEEYRPNDVACTDQKCAGFAMRHCTREKWNRRA